MTGIMMAVAGSSGGSLFSGTWSASTLSGAMTAGSTPLGGYFQIYTNGSFGTFLQGNSGPGNVSGTQSWFEPSKAAIGDLYWVRATVTAGAADFGTFNVWQQLTANRQFGIANYTTAGNKSCTIRFEWSTNASGSPIVLTAAGNVINMTHA
jgi:hypothetical protein